MATLEVYGADPCAFGQRDGGEAAIIVERVCARLTALNIPVLTVHDSFDRQDRRHVDGGDNFTR